MDNNRCINDAVRYRKCDFTCLSDRKRKQCYLNLANDIKICEAKYYEAQVKDNSYNYYRK